MNRWTKLLIGSVALAGAVGCYFLLGSFSEPEPKAGEDYAYTEKARAEVLADCAAEGTDVEWCACFYDWLEENVPPRELRQIEMEIDEFGEPAPERQDSLKRALEACPLE